MTIYEKLKTIEVKYVYQEIGVTALRSPDGGYLPAEPLYVKVPAKDVKDGVYVGENATLQNVAEIFADKYKQYVEGVRNLSRGTVKGEAL